LPPAASRCTGIDSFARAMKFRTEIDQLAQVRNARPSILARRIHQLKRPAVESVIKATSRPDHLTSRRIFVVIQQSFDSNLTTIRDAQSELLSPVARGSRSWLLRSEVIFTVRSRF
jgi:hypothetical protein